MVHTGSQGTVIYKTLSGAEVAIKSSKYNDLCIELEAKVLQQITTECPELSDHFPKFIELTADKKLVMSRIKGEELVDFINRLIKSNCKSLRKRAHSIIKNICFIALCVLEKVRRKTGIIHNDLHTSNVMVVKTEKENLSFNFEEKNYNFKTYGYFPVIIDFGYAHIEGPFVMGSFQNSDIGCTIEDPDLLSDSRLLLTTAIIWKERHNVNNIFKELNLDHEGWFSKYTFINVYDELYDIGRKPFSKIMDSALTVTISLMGDLKEDTSKPCCEECYFLYVNTEEESIEEESIEEEKLCECSQKAKNCFEEMYDIVHEKKNNSEIYEKAAIIFKPFVTRTLAHNRDIKQKAYSKLSVKNSLDVIDILIGK